MSRIQLSYGEGEKNKKIAKLRLPRNYRASGYFKFLPYLHNVEKPNFQTSITNVINNRHDLRNFLLASRDVSKSIQENLNAVVADGRLNDAIIRHALDTTNKNILVNPNPLQVTFKDVKKFDAQNPIVGKLLTQVESNKLTDKKIREQLGQVKDRGIEARLLNFQRNNNNNSNNSNNNDGGRPGGRLDLPPPPLPSPRAPDQPFDLFFGATAAPLLPSPSRTEPLALPYPDDLPPPPGYNTLLAERIAIANTEPNLRTGSRHRLTIGIILRVREAERTAPELPPKEQIRLSPTLVRVFPEAGDWFGEDDHNEEGTAQPEFTLPNYNQIRDALNEGEIPPELELFTGGRNQRLLDMVNSIWIDQDRGNFLDYLQEKICENLMKRNRINKKQEISTMIISVPERVSTLFLLPSKIRQKN